MLLRTAVVVTAAVLVPAPAAEGATVYRVEADSVYVRNKAAGFVIGTLVRGDTVTVQITARRRAWGYGLVGGGFGRWGGRRCGWVQLQGKGRVLRSTGRSTPAECPRSQHALNEASLFQPGSYLARAGFGAVIPVTVKPCIHPRAFGNYDPMAAAARAPVYGVIPVGRGPEAPGFGLRYVSRDGRVAVVKDTRNPAGAPSWFFMAADCLERLPVYIGRRSAPGPAFPFVPFGNRLVEPTTLETYKDLIIVRTRWNRWTGLRADGTGTARMNTCEPSCANGRIVRRARARISVSQPRRGFCFGRPAFFYTKASVLWPQGLGLRQRRRAFELVSGCGNS